MTNPIREALEAARPLIALGAIEPERIAEEHAAAAKIDVALALLGRIEAGRRAGMEEAAEEFETALDGTAWAEADVRKRIERIRAAAKEERTTR